jgi:transcriptional regulator with XRE-family HTH domain
MNSYREELKREFSDKEYRDAYAEDFLNTKIATQLRAIREQRRLTQKDLAEKIGTKQPGVARLEDVNYASWSIAMLEKLASALDVRLNVSFETFGSLLDEDESFSRAWLERPDFDSDPAFQRVTASASSMVGMGSISKDLAGKEEFNQERNTVTNIDEWKAKKRERAQQPAPRSMGAAMAGGR